MRNEKCQQHLHNPFFFSPSESMIYRQVHSFIFHFHSTLPYSLLSVRQKNTLPVLLQSATALLLLLRPLSGSGALTAAAELVRRFGPDSLVGRTAAVMIGSSETTFYVVAVYFSAAGAGGSRRAIPAALLADLVCFLSSAWICRALWG